MRTITFCFPGLSLLLATAMAAQDIRRDATVEAVQKVIPAVVNISTKTVVKRQGYLYDWWRNNWAPYTQELPPEYSAGSGVIISEDGFVLTNVHVVDQATEISVKLADGRVLEAQALVGTTKSDVALLKLVGKPGEKFKAVHFAPDGDLLLGETVLALGNPFGLGGSVSKGILSALPRRSEAAMKGPLDIEDWLQTDAAINPGNSGGPLVNMRGELIGLNVAIYRDGQGIGFAIPVKRLSEALGEIFTPELIKSLWFGAKVQSREGKLVLTSLQIGSPAEKAGLRTGDQIIKINERAPGNLFEFNRELMTAGDQKDVTLVLQRGTERRNATLRLVPERRVFNANYLREKLGIQVVELNAALSARSRLPMNEGLYISGVDRGSPAEAVGFDRGLVLQAIDDQPVPTISSAAKMLMTRKTGQSVSLTVYLPARGRSVVVDVRVR